MIPSYIVLIFLRIYSLLWISLIFHVCYLYYAIRFLANYFMLKLFHFVDSNATSPDSPIFLADLWLLLLKIDASGNCLRFCLFVTLILASSSTEWLLVSGTSLMFLAFSCYFNSLCLLADLHLVPLHSFISTHLKYNIFPRILEDLSLRTMLVSYFFLCSFSK